MQLKVVPIQWITYALSLTPTRWTTSTRAHQHNWQRDPDDAGGDHDRVLGDEVDEPVEAEVWEREPVEADVGNFDVEEETAKSLSQTALGAILSI
jgi:hypothetical protein